MSVASAAQRAQAPTTSTYTPCIGPLAPFDSTDRVSYPRCTTSTTALILFIRRLSSMRMPLLCRPGLLQCLDTRTRNHCLSLALFLASVCCFCARRRMIGVPPFHSFNQFVWSHFSIDTAAWPAVYCSASHHQHRRPNVLLHFCDSPHSRVRPQLWCHPLSNIRALV